MRNPENLQISSQKCKSPPAGVPDPGNSSGPDPPYGITFTPETKYWVSPKQLVGTPTCCR